MTVIKFFNQPVSSLSLQFLRFGYGLTTTIIIIRYFYFGWIHTYFIQPTFFFKHFGLEWVPNLPPSFIYLLFIILLLTSIGILFGYFVRTNLMIFTIGFTWFHFIDATIYLNHYYLISILGFLLWLSPISKYDTPITGIQNWIRTPMPVTKLWIYAFRLQIGLVYFFGGLAKLQPDWMWEALPLKLWLYQSEGKLPWFDPILGLPVTAYVFSWIGILFDLSIPFLLCFARFRLVTWSVVLLFHSFTSFLFPIGVFPIVMSVSSLIFFPADWPKQVWNRFFKEKDHKIQLEDKENEIPSNSRLYPIEGILIVFLLFQILIPFRHLFYPGQVTWTEEGIKFSWQVMVADKVGEALFFVQGKSIDPRNELTEYQYRMMVIQPEHLIQYAKHIQSKAAIETGQKDIPVYVQSHVSLNGKRTKPLFAPDVDLTKIEINFLPLKGLNR
ncbi:MAG: HTTM domain-containing protein [Leptospira sp.]|uniref:HTTM domain-containing protein n=1 Tax=Leptospira paudalimensis TaxID=2950024 RepID=A0ABT3M844_9LEPT|nr:MULTISPECIES: HTTM domain-containing protein [Leptospira]MBL0954145.1 HTTM domain-containing protein [Leptospira sp.]MCW7504555.1 HTTM domain-containing protein [Leptospira paudalimensis]